MAGAPIGNQNAVKAKRWQQAIDRALANRSRAKGIEELDRLAEIYLDAVERGEQNYIRGFESLADRMDGKATQPLEHSGDIHLTIAQSDANL